MGKKALVKIEEGATTASVAYGCAALLDAGIEQQLGPAIAAEAGLAAGGQLAVRIAHRIEQLRQLFEASDEAVAKITDELRRWRRLRDQAHEQLYDQAKSLRKICRALFDGDEGDLFLGLRGKLPREPKELHSRFGRVVRRLADAEWPAPVSRRVGIRMDRGKVVESVIEAYGDLGRALAAIKEGEAREQMAKVARKRARTAHDTFLTKSGRYLEAALDLAGLDDLAATVRPSVGRMGRPPKKRLAGATPSLQALPTATDPRSTAELEGTVVAETGTESSVDAAEDDV